MNRILFAWLAAVAFAAHGRTWTSTSGSQVEADYVGFRNNTVTLKKADGKTVDVGLQFLSEADREFVRAQTAALPSAAPPAFQTPVTKTVGGSSGSTRHDLLSDEQLKALKTEMPSGRDNGKIYFRAAFGPPRLSDAEIRRYKKKEDIPFRVTAELLEMTESRGKMTAKRLPGSVRFYVLDEDKTVVLSRRESLDKMCPT